jgi:hypothetical protein
MMLFEIDHSTELFSDQGHEVTSSPRRPMSRKLVEPLGAKSSSLLIYSLENSHNPFTFNQRIAAIFMVRLWLAEP